MKIVFLIEDRSGRPGLGVEHGLALWVEHAGGRWLFDAGRSGLVVRNAAELGIALGTAEGILLSHGHYDHTGGLPAVLADMREKRIFAHPDIFRKRWRLRKDKKPRSIGFPARRKAIERAGGKFIFNRGPREIAPGIFLSGPVPRTVDGEKGRRSLAVGEAGRFRPDDFQDEQFLLAETRGGLVMLSGCCHAGLINSLRHLRALRPRRAIRAVIGGFHLVRARPSTIERTLDELEACRPALVVAGHCTGEKAERAMAEKFGRRFLSLRAGTTIEL